MNFLHKGLDLLTDRRMPPYVPALWLRRAQIQRQLSKVTLASRPAVLFSFTVDTEQDHGSGSPIHSTETLDPFFDSFAPFMNSHALPATLFIQGDLVKQSAPALRQALAHGFELGLHGYHHELWGSAPWFINEKVLPASQRATTLKTALRAFSECGLPRPVSFRAPNMVIDDPTYRALAAQGFLYDSSPSVFRGVSPLSSQSHGVHVIPVSADPLPHIRFKRGIPTGEFRVFNFYNLYHLSPDEVVAMADRMVRFQLAHGLTPHLVFLSHSWEFVLWDHAYDRLREQFARLQTHFELKGVTFSDLNQSLHDTV